MVSSVCRSVACLLLLACGGGSSTSDANALEPDAAPSDAGPDPDATIEPDAGGIGPPPPPLAPCAATLLFPSVPMADIGGGPRKPTAGDFNGDGKLDLAVANIANYISILIGHGDGTFAPAVNYPTEGLGAAGALATADLDADGHLDLLVANADRFTLRALRGIGDGTFAPAATLATTTTRPWRLAVADLDNDGKLDVVTLNYNPDPSPNPWTVNVFLGDGFALGAPASFAADVKFVGMIIADVNGDGNRDVVTVANGISVHFGNGNGTLQAVQTTSMPVGSGVESMAAGDFDGDGDLDLALGTIASGLRLMLGVGNGTFLPSTAIIPGRFSRGLVTTDMNGDGKRDIVGLSARGQDDDVTVLLGNGNATFGSPATYVGSHFAGLVLGDFDGNGRPDVILANYGSGSIDILLERDNGALRSIPRYTIGPSPSASFKLASGDFNGDGALDLAAMTYSLLVVARGNGDGTFQTPQSTTMPTDFYGSIVAADITNDGALDLVTPQGVFVNVDHGTSFEATRYFSGSSGNRALAADVNGDGMLDVVVSGTGTLSVSLNSNAGLLPPIVDNNNPVFVWVNAAIDLNADGKLDLVGHDSSTDPWSVVRLLGNGDGTFQPGAAVTGRVPGDFDQDGKLDLVSTTGIQLGNGDGTFHSGVAFDFSAQFQEVEGSGDFDRDGKLDLFLVHDYGKFGIARGNGDGTFRAPVFYGLGEAGILGSYIRSDAFAIGDFSRDGGLDVVSTMGDHITVLLQTGCLP